LNPETSSETEADNPDHQPGSQPTGKASVDLDFEENTVSSDNSIREAAGEMNTPPSSPTPWLPESPDPPGQDSQESVSIPQIPLSPHFEEEDKGLEPTTSSQKSVIDDIDIPATWLKVEDFWLNLHVDDEPAALNTALDFMMQLQNLSK
jgi:hypothetical protein